MNRRADVNGGNNLGWQLENFTFNTSQKVRLQSMVKLLDKVFSQLFVFFFQDF